MPKTQSNDYKYFAKVFRAENSKLPTLDLLNCVKKSKLVITRQNTFEDSQVTVRDALQLKQDVKVGNTLKKELRKQ